MLGAMSNYQRRHRHTCSRFTADRPVTHRKKRQNWRAIAGNSISPATTAAGSKPIVSGLILRALNNAAGPGDRDDEVTADRICCNALDTDNLEFEVGSAGRIKSIPGDEHHFGRRHPQPLLHQRIGARVRLESTGGVDADHRLQMPAQPAVSDQRIQHRLRAVGQDRSRVVGQASQRLLRFGVR